MKIEKREWHSNALALTKTATSSDNADLLIVEGYGCHFGTANGNGEIVTEASFADFFAELNNGGQMPYFNYQHMPDQIIGGWDEIRADEHGLYMRGHINKRVALVRDTVLPLIESGDLAGLSTEGYSMGWWDDEANVWHAEKFLLLGVSLVSLPADFAAQMIVRNNLLLQRGQFIENNPDNDELNVVINY